MARLKDLLFIEMQHEDCGVVAQAVQELGQWTDSLKRCKQVVQLCGHGLLVLAIRKWPQHEEIQANCLGILVEFTHHCGDLVHEPLAVMGLVELTVAAIERFPNSNVVQQWGLQTMSNLLTDEENEEIRKGMELFVDELNGISLLVQAMKRFPHDQRLNLTGCTFVYNLCNSGYKDALIRGKATSVVVAAMENFPEDKHVREEAEDAIRILFHKRAAVKR
jgi:hypothetical protein